MNTSKQAVNLEFLLKEIKKNYFPDIKEVPSIKWSKGHIQKRYKHITLGSYHIIKQEIRIHPLLSTAKNHSKLISFVIFHEMLHHFDKENLKNHLKNQKVHTKAFRDKEKNFPEYETIQKEIKYLIS